jgi:opacity protein-like surface antigen
MKKLNLKKISLAVIIALILSFGANTAQAQIVVPVQTVVPAQPYPYFPEGAGPYFRVGVGPSFFQNGQLNYFGGPFSARVQYNAEFASDVALGYAFNPYVATDFELGFIGAGINNVDAADFYTHNAYLYSFPFLANVILSYPIPRSIVTPYIGVGVGGANDIFDAGNNFGGEVYGSENDVVFAWQAFAGLRFQLNPWMSLGIGYKYFATGSQTFSYPPYPNFDVGFDGVRTHSVLFTFQMNFW